MKPGSSNTTGLSPPLPFTAPPAPKSTIPIARASNPAWEKPERARTSHACEPCRERKTKCDGSRPACRRCLHTGTTCYYGYGKGWRKRKTAEDLTATSRRLARYESLLNEILPMVSPEVRVLIEEARDNDTATSNNGSETNETEQNLPPPMLLNSEPGMSASSGRIILPLPVPSPHVPTASRSSTSSGTFDPIPPPTITGASAAVNIQPGQRLSPDSSTGTRLPSITAEGLLIDAVARDHSPTSLHRPHDTTGGYGQDRLGALPSPTGHPSHGGALFGPRPGRYDTDDRKREYETTTFFPWLRASESATVTN